MEHSALFDNLLVKLRGHLVDIIAPTQWHFYHLTLEHPRLSCCVTFMCLM